MRTTLTLVACIIVALVLCTSVAATQHVAPLGRLLDGYYPRMSDQDEVIIWIYFTDKGVAAQQKMTAAPTTYLSERAIQRRQKALKTTTVIDMQDVPLEQSYVEQVKGMVRKFRHEVKWFNAASAIATKSQIELIRRLPFVSEVDAVVRYRTAKIAAQEPSTFSPPVYPANPETTFSYGGSLTQNQQINTVAVHNLGITGQGVLIGIFDDSFPDITTHPALATRTIIAKHDFVDNDTVFHNNDTHGQETFSTVGGFQNGQHIGPAFGASFVLARTEQAASETPIEEDNWARAVIWADSIGIDVSSTSLGYNDPTGPYDPPWPSYGWQDMNGATTVITRAADRAAALGITVVNSAGNAGDNASHNTLGAPADGFNVITAGAVTSSGTRASFSAVGPTPDGRIKPDIMAMGSGVQVALGSSGYSSADGTSFSCPLSAGVAALVISGNLNFNLTPYQVREAMRQTASHPNTPDRLTGWGILNAFNAVHYPWIEHTALTNTEDTTARLVLVTIKSRVPPLTDSSRVYYGIGGSFTNSVLLTPTANPNEYSALLPYLGSGVNVTYYIRTKNQYVATRSPLTGSYGYQVGQDLTGPTIVHREIGNQALSSWPPQISATVTDVSGINSVTVECKLNGVALPSFGLPLVNGVYTDTLHISRSQVHAGDTASYRIVATDSSRQHNVTTYPASGEVRLAVLVFYNRATTFDDSPSNFTGTNDWQWGVPSGTSPHARSGLKCWGTILAGNYTVGPRLSTLTMPLSRVYSSKASFSFWQWYEIQSRYDGGNVKVSVNHGAFQIITPVGGYTPQLIYNGFGNPLGGQAGYTSVAGTTWSKATFDLTGIANEGDSVAIRFDFGADNSIQYRGWYIDDFSSDGIGGPAPSNAANLGVDRDTVDFGNIPIGHTDSSQSIVVTNFGQNALNVTNISSSNPAFSVNRTSFSVNYLDTMRVKLYFTAPTPGGQRTGALTFTSNSNPPAPAVQLRATSIGQASLIAAPDTFYFERLPGPDTTRSSFIIRNPGTDTLRYTISETIGSSLKDAPAIQRSETPRHTVPVGKGAVDPNPGESDSSGGPDAFGYRWIDSGSPGGPTFNWVNISTVGTPITAWTGTADDGYATVPFPFPFRFYGTTFSGTLNVCTNGFLSFTSTQNDYSNLAIPDATAPENGIFPFWDDLNLTSSGSVYYYNDIANNRFIVEYLNVPHFSSGGPYTFEVIFRPDGTILYQYQTMDLTLVNSSTIGIQNASGTVALQVVYNANYARNNLAVLLTTDILPWVSTSPTSGVIGPGDSAAVELRIHPAGLRADTLYTGRLRITGNTPDISVIRLGLRTTTTGVGTGAEVPAVFALEQNYPNPFNPTTAINYQLAAASHVSLKVFDVLGREVATIVNETKAAGKYNVVWDARNVASGLYFYRLEAGTFMAMKKMLLLK